MSNDLDLSVIIPAMSQTESLALLLPELHRELNSLGVSSEVVVVLDWPDPQILALASEHGVRALEQPGRTYGPALEAAFATARGTYLLTIDPDLFRRPTFIGALWSRRLEGEIMIASRYVKGGRARMPRSRCACCGSTAETSRRRRSPPSSWHWATTASRSGP